MAYTEEDLPTITRAEFNQLKGISAPQMEDDGIPTITREEFNLMTGFSGQNEIQETPSLFGSFGSGLWEGAKNLIPDTYNTIKAIPSGLKNVGNVIMNPLDSIDDGTAQKVANTTVKGSLGLLGGIGGALLGPAGSAAGASTGALLGEKILQLGGASPETNLEEDVKSLGYGIGGGMVPVAASKAIPAAVKGFNKVGSVVRNAKADLLDNAGASRVASDVYRTAATNPEAALQALDQVDNTGLNQFKTSAELSGDAGLGALEQNLPIPEMNKVLQEKGLAREAARKQLLNDIVPDSGATIDDLGKDIRSKLFTDKEGIRSAAKDLFENIDPTQETKIPRYSLLKTAKELENTYFGDGSGGLPSELKNVVKDLSSDKTWKPYQYYQNIKSRLGEIKRNADKMGNERTAAFAGNLEAEVVNHIDNAVNNGLFTAKQAEDWGKARGLWKQQAEQYGTGTIGNYLQTAVNGEYDGFRSSPGSIFDAAIANPAKAGNIMKAVESDATTLNKVREGVMQKFLDKAQGTDMSLKPSAVQNFFKNEQSLSKIFEPEHVNNIKQVVEDLSSQTSFKSSASLASKGNSITGQKMTTAQAVRDQILNNFGIAGKAMQNNNLQNLGGLAGWLIKGPVGSAAGWLGGLAVKGKFDAQINKVNALIAEAAADPQIARQLLKPYSKPTADLISQKIMSKIESGSNMLNQPIAGSMAGLSKERESKPVKEENVTEITIRPKRGGLTGLTAEEEKKQKNPGLFSTEPLPITYALMQTESGGNSKAVSPVGAQGLMQLMPDTGKELAKRAGVKYNPFDPEQNFKLGAEYYNSLKSKYKDHDLALTAYNWGPGNLDKLIKKVGTMDYDRLRPYLPKETRDHRDRTMRNLTAMG